MVFVAQLALFALLSTFSLAAPIGHGNHAAVAHRRSCNAKTTTSAEPSSTVVVPTATSVKSTKTSSSVEPSATGGSKNPNTNLLALFPVSINNALSSWSTSSLVSDPAPLNDATLNIYSGKNTPHKYMNAPEGSPALRALFEAGSISPGHSSSIGGFSLYSKGKTDLSKGTEVTFSYSAYFEKGFDFNLGGKMPGLYGGTDDKVATTCSGGRHNPDCWSARLMWRQNGEGELYAYLPQIDSNAKAFSQVVPKTVSNDVYGTSVGRGSYKWATGQWTQVAQRIKLNDIGQKNGEIEVYANGESVIKVTGLSFRTSAQSLVRGAQIQTFFGGHTEEWASPKTQSAYFKDFSAAVIA